MENLILLLVGVVLGRVVPKVYNKIKSKWSK